MADAEGGPAKGNLVAVASPSGQERANEQGLSTALSLFLAQLNDFGRQTMEEDEHGNVGPAQDQAEPAAAVPVPGEPAAKRPANAAGERAGLARRPVGASNLGVNPGLSRTVPPSDETTKAAIPSHRPEPMKVLPPVHRPRATQPNHVSSPGGTGPAQWQMGAVNDNPSRPPALGVADLGAPAVAPVTASAPAPVAPKRRRLSADKVRRTRLFLACGLGAGLTAVALSVSWGINQHNGLHLANQQLSETQSAMSTLNQDLSAQAARYRSLHHAMALFMLQFDSNRSKLSKAEVRLQDAQSQLAQAQSQVDKAQSQLDNTQQNLTTTQSHATQCQVSSSLGQQTVQLLAAVNLSEIGYLNAAQNKDLKVMHQDIGQMRLLLRQEQLLGPRFTKAVLHCTH